MMICNVMRTFLLIIIPTLYLTVIANPLVTSNTKHGSDVGEAIC